MTFFFFGDVIAVTNFSGKNFVPPQMGLRSYAHAHKESCHKLLSLILVREQGLYIIKTDCSGKRIVAFTIKEKNYLMVSLFCQLALPFPIDICGIKFLIWLRY